MVDVIQQFPATSLLALRSICFASPVLLAVPKNHKANNPHKKVFRRTETSNRGKWLQAVRITEIPISLKINIHTEKNLWLNFMPFQNDPFFSPDYFQLLLSSNSYIY